ncbi:MAG: hypothetical protein M1497_10065 [Nitrospirae bacterium]|nr:hypothetical protein [Nitrospirota bacterium]
MKKMAALLIVCILLLSSASAFAETDEAFVAAADAVIARPFGLAAIVVGGAFFVVSLPFALASNSVKQTGDMLVGEPFRFTFTRPLGDFRQSGSYGETKGSRQRQESENTTEK